MTARQDPVEHLQRIERDPELEDGDADAQRQGERQCRGERPTEADAKWRWAGGRHDGPHGGMRGAELLRAECPAPGLRFARRGADVVTRR